MRYHFSDAEIKAALKTMVVVVDSREQENEHITRYFNAKGIPWITAKLDVGDYSARVPSCDEMGLSRGLDFSSSIVVERKGSLDELAGNLTKDRTRFEDELLRARWTKVALLVEDATYGDIVNGKYRSKYNAKSFVATLAAYSARFNLDVSFVERPFSGNWIYHRLYYAVREALLRG